MNSTKQIIHINMTDFVQSIIDASQEGWALDPQNPPGLYGWSYETGMIRDASIVDDTTPSRADILAAARSAKKLKKLAEANTESTSE